MEIPISKNRSFISPELNYIVQTPYEKVLYILSNLKEKTKILNDDQIISDIDYIVKTITSNNLYSYSLQKETKSKIISDKNLTNISESDMNELDIIMSSLFEYSEKETNLMLLSKTNSSNSPNKILRNIKYHERFKTTKENTCHDVFDRLQKKLVKNESNLNNSSFENIISVDTEKENLFNIFDFYDKHNELSFEYIARFIYQRLGLFEIINNDKFKGFISSIRCEYKQVPYHNEKHGIDVCHSVYSFLDNHYIRNIYNISKLEVLSIITAALCHDIGHQGFSNNFHINTLSSYAINSNDISVLESYHIKLSTEIILSPNNNILDCLSLQNFKYFRKIFIEAILSTDMTKHSKLNAVIKSKIDLLIGDKSFENKIEEIQILSNFLKEDEGKIGFLNFLLHTADLSHNSKMFNISEKWVQCLTEEFWIQGDVEYNLKLSPSFLCDRLTNNNIPHLQIGFIKGIVVPSFDLLVKLIPSLQYYLKNIENNLKMWEKLKDDRVIYESNQRINKFSLSFITYFNCFK